MAKTLPAASLPDDFKSLTARLEAKLPPIPTREIDGVELADGGLVFGPAASLRQRKALLALCDFGCSNSKQHFGDTQLNLLNSSSKRRRFRSE